jgi:hypothetical protein
MGLHGTKGLVAAALVCAAVSGTAGAAERGMTPLEGDARDVPVVTGGEVVYTTADGAVRSVDEARGAASRRVLTRACPAAPGAPVVQAASGGYALLECLVADRGPRLRVLDLADGSLVEPAAPARAYDPGVGDRLEITGIAGRWLCYTLTFDKGVPEHDRSLWAPGDPAGPRLPCATRRAPVTTAGGVTVSSSGTTRTVALTRCGARVSWSRVAPSSRWQAVPGGVVIADGVGPYAIGYRDLSDVCSRVASRWRLVFSAGGRGTPLVPVSAAGRERALGARVEVRSARGASATRSLGRGTAIVRPATAARSLRWRLDRGRWHGASRGRDGWRLGGLPTRTRSTLELAVRYRDGAVARYRLRLR